MVTIFAKTELVQYRFRWGIPRDVSSWDGPKLTMVETLAEISSNYYNLAESWIIIKVSIF